MSELTTTGTWIVDPAKEVAFVDAWASFAEWASTMPGATTLRLTRDENDERRFVSFAAWDSPEAVREWKATPDFMERMAQILQHVDDFRPEELIVVATAINGDKSIELKASSTRTA
jgi:heme-degrading monooxygenase HmoA